MSGIRLIMVNVVYIVRQGSIAINLRMNLLPIMLSTGYPLRVINSIAIQTFLHLYD